MGDKSAIDCSGPDPVFDSAEWIGKGHHYPVKNTPFFITQAHSQTFGPPERLQELLPARNLPVLYFTARILPNQSLRLSTTKAQTWLRRRRTSSVVTARRGEASSWLDQLRQMGKWLGSACSSEPFELQL
ncbi:hypothetical protein OBBRIDRAFT_822105 [Obba rivulosa]|uniref:Uncharacterized protein n=1 Tax=Obba rivulosa TaxID=1052685 RepID=A0A8E2J7A9_9APHY|nr:hypothetical protein OBBRIDRAFT_822105 [Obba rivulosa]